MSWLVGELLTQAGRELEFNEQPGSDLRLSVDGREILSGQELERMFSVLSLEAEQSAPLDHFGRANENAPVHAPDTPWITERAREVFASGKRPAPLTVFLTHDVDRTTGLELTSLVKAAKGTLTGRRGQWLGLFEALDHGLMGRRLRELLELEVKEGVRGIWFMIAGPSGLGRYDSRTDIHWRSARSAAEEILAAGGHLGLHGSFHAAERDLYAFEAERIRQVTGAKVNLHRNHYLRLNTRRFCTQLEQAGIAVDFTLGYSQRTGFRNGVCVPFRPWNLDTDTPGNLAAVPLVFMEKPGYQLDPEPMLRDLDQKLASAASCGGAVSLLVHPEVFAVDRRWFDVYREIIELCRHHGVLMDADPAGILPAVAGQRSPELG